MRRIVSGLFLVSLFCLTGCKNTVEEYIENASHSSQIEQEAKAFHTAVMLFIIDSNNYNRINSDGRTGFCLKDERVCVEEMFYDLTGEYYDFNIGSNVDLDPLTTEIESPKYKAEIDCLKVDSENYYDQLVYRIPKYKLYVNISIYGGRISEPINIK